MFLAKDVSHVDRLSAFRLARILVSVGVLALTLAFGRHIGRCSVVDDARRVEGKEVQWLS